MLIEMMQVKERSQIWTGDGNNVKLTVSVTGFGTLSYQWMKDGEDVTSVKYPKCTGSDTANLSINSFSSEYEGNYSCRVTDEAGQSIESDSIKVKGIYVF